MDKLINNLKRHDISHETLDAMKKVDRIKFIPINKIESRKKAYEDTALSIGYDVTISQPSLVGKMIDMLNLDTINHVLELGTGSAYNAAIIGKLVPYGKVITVERVKPLAVRAKKLLTQKNIQVIIGDATNIKYKHPFDRIIVTAEFLNKREIEEFVIKYAAKFSMCVFPYNGWLWKIIKCDDKIVFSDRIFQVRFVPVLSGIKQ